jgi:hypothetical protein
LANGGDEAVSVPAPTSLCESRDRDAWNQVAI